MRKYIYWFSKYFLIYVTVFLIGVAMNGGELLGLGPVLKMPFYPLKIALSTYGQLDRLDNGHLSDYNDSLPDKINVLNEDLFIMNTVRNAGEPFIEIRNLRNDSIINCIAIPKELQTTKYRQRYFACLNDRKDLVCVFTHDNFNDESKIGLFDVKKQKYTWIRSTDSIILHHRIQFQENNLIVNIRKREFVEKNDLTTEGYAIIDGKSGDFIKKWLVPYSQIPSIIDFQGTKFGGKWDYLHLNDVEIVNLNGQRSGVLETGDVLLSSRSLNAILHIREDSIIATYTGLFFKQHDIDVVNANTISVFNNNAHDVSYPWIKGYKSNIVYKNLINNSDSIAYHDIGLNTYTEGQFIQIGSYKYFENQNQGEIIIVQNDKIVYRNQQLNSQDKTKVNLLNWCSIWQ
jgi:hypothetical protein